MLTAASVLGTYFERAKATGVLDQTARTGLVRPRRHEPVSPHNSLVCLIAAALPQPDAAKALAQDGLVPSFIKREYVSVPSWVIGQFAKHHGIVRENERAANAALLGRIQRSLRPEKLEAEAAE